ncbi:hypothetical protein BG004_002670 [Podila humilis]|nr:hypothetical protein BG004_002670 [Podila humilis]
MSTIKTKLQPSAYRSSLTRRGKDVDILVAVAVVSAYDGTGKVRCKKNMSGASRGYQITSAVTGGMAALSALFCPPCAAIIGTLSATLGGLSAVPESFTCPDGTSQDGEYCVKDVSSDLGNLISLLGAQYNHCLRNVWGCRGNSDPNCQATVRQQCWRDKEDGDTKIFQAMEGIERACNE